MSDFYVRQTTNSFPNEVGKMSEMEVYAHVRNRLDYDMIAAEEMLRRLDKKGETTERATNALGIETVIEICSVSPANE